MIKLKGDRGRVCGKSVDGGSHGSMLDDEEGAPTSSARESRLFGQQTKRRMRCVVKCESQAPGGARVTAVFQIS